MMQYTSSSHSVHAIAKVSKLQTKTMNALIVIDVHAKESDSFATTQAVATVTSMV